MDEALVEAIALRVSSNLARDGENVDQTMLIFFVASAKITGPLDIAYVCGGVPINYLDQNLQLLVLADLQRIELRTFLLKIILELATREDLHIIALEHHSKLTVHFRIFSSYLYDVLAEGAIVLLSFLNKQL